MDAEIERYSANQLNFAPFPSADARARPLHRSTAPVALRNRNAVYARGLIENLLPVKKLRKRPQLNCGRGDKFRFGDFNAGVKWRLYSR
jgi:hypothetical protein